MHTKLQTLSPLDGRYQKMTQDIAKLTSEQALIHCRVIVEIAWLEQLSQNPEIGCPKINQNTQDALDKLKLSLTLEEAQIVKDIESEIFHDVKAVEYFIQKIVKANGQPELIPWIHFACTSEDINNTAYALMANNLKQKVIVPELSKLLKAICDFAEKNAANTMLGWTHGQPATPTTIGKEFAVFASRILKKLEQIINFNFSAKFNGAVGNHNAHLAAYPNLDWHAISKSMINSLNLEYNKVSTQISNHDNLVEFLSIYRQVCLINLDLCQDSWLYIHKNYLILKKENEQQVGSSTMPHKINPIDFENAEGNIQIFKALSGILIEKLPISRMQRDLSDSTALRNIGSCFAHSIIAFKSIQKGILKLSANSQFLQQELNNHWEITSEAIQTILRKHGDESAYETMKSLTQGKKIDPQTVHRLIENMPEAIKLEITNISPETYSGYAERNTIEICKLVRIFLDKLIFN